jgi:tRNA(Ile)-lysidine synthetase-like protein
MSDLLDRVRQYVRRYRLLEPGAMVVAGVSGGPDSLCLLHLLRRLAPELGLRLHVAHLNHGLRGAEADADEGFVAALATEWGLPCTTGRVQVGELAAAHGHSLEEAARQARYRFLAEVAQAQGARVIAVGHHADDQAETVLMHFLRGSGVAGLRGMLPASSLHVGWLPDDEAESAAEAKATEGEFCQPQLAVPSAPASGELFLVRPLLAVTRAEIAAYCAEHGLRPRFDRSNEDTTYFRNRLRLELIPLLEQYNPGIRAVLARTAELMAGEAELLRASLEAAWGQVVLPSPAGEVYFDLQAWRALPLGLQRATLRQAIYHLRRNLRDVNWVHIERAVWLAREGLTGQQATLVAGLVLEVGYQALRVGPAGSAGRHLLWSAGVTRGSFPPTTSPIPQVTDTIPLAVPGITSVGGGWQVEVVRLAPASLPPDVPGDDPWTAYLDAEAVGDDLALRPRQPGDRFQPQGLGGHSVRLHEFMINLKVPRPARAGWPLLIGRFGIAWVCGLRVDERARVCPETTSVWRVRFARGFLP